MDPSHIYYMEGIHSLFSPYSVKLYQLGLNSDDNSKFQRY